MVLVLLDNNFVYDPEDSRLNFVVDYDGIVLILNFEMP